MDWILTLFSKALPLDLATRIWDVFVYEGESFIFRSLLGIMRLLSARIVSQAFDDNMLLLTHLPADIDGDALFRCIKEVPLSAKQYEALRLRHVGDVSTILKEMGSQQQ